MGHGVLQVPIQAILHIALAGETGLPVFTHVSGHDVGTAAAGIVKHPQHAQVFEPLSAVIRGLAHFLHHAKHQRRQVLIGQHVQVGLIHFRAHLMPLVQPHIGHQRPLLAVIAEGQRGIPQLIQRLQKITAGGVRLIANRLPVVQIAFHPVFHLGGRFGILEKIMLPARGHARTGGQGHHSGYCHPSMTLAHHPPVIPGQARLRIDDFGEQALGEQARRLATTLGRLNRVGHLVVPGSSGDKGVLGHTFLQHRGEVGTAYQCRRGEGIRRQQIRQELLHGRLQARQLAGERISRRPFFVITGVGQHVRQAFGELIHHIGVTLGKLFQPLVLILLAVQPEGEPQGLILLRLAESTDKRRKSVHQIHLGEGHIHRQPGPKLFHQLPQAGAQQNGVGFTLLFVGGAQARKIHSQDNAIERPLGPTAFQPGDKVVPQPALDFTGGTLALVLAQQFAIRVDQDTVVANPPVKTERVTVAPVVTGDVGQGIGLPGTLNQAGLTGIFQAHHQIPGQTVQALATRQIAFQRLQLAVQQPLLATLHGQNRVFLLPLLLGLGLVHFTQATGQHGTPDHHHQQDHPEGDQSTHLPGHQRVVAVDFQAWPQPPGGYQQGNYPQSQGDGGGAADVGQKPTTNE